VPVKSPKLNPMENLKNTKKTLQDGSQDQKAVSKGALKQGYLLN
jgi:hypothetical protein